MIPQTKAKALWESVAKTDNAIQGVLAMTLYYVHLNEGDFEITIDEDGEIVRIADGEGETIYE